MTGSSSHAPTYAASYPVATPLCRSIGANYAHAAANQLGSVAPGFILDARGRNYLGGNRVPITRLLTCTNASTVRTSVLRGQIVSWPANTIRFDDSTGVYRMLFEGARTNLLINSDAPSTQNVTTTATTYTVSFYGTGTITWSGTASGSLNGTGASTRVKSTLTATAGTLTVTMSGSVAFAQVERGDNATSYMPNGASSVAVPTDVPQISGAAATSLFGGAAALAWRGYVPQAVAGWYYFSTNSTPILYPDNTTPSNLIVYGPVNPIQFGSVTLPGAANICFGWGASGGYASVNGLTPTNCVAQALTMTAAYIGRTAGLAARQVIYLDQLIGWTLTDRPTSAAVQAQARGA